MKNNILKIAFLAAGALAALFCVVILSELLAKYKLDSIDAAYRKSMRKVIELEKTRPLIPGIQSDIDIYRVRNTAERLEYDKYKMASIDTGFITVPNSTARHSMRTEKEVIFNVSYTHDNFGRRVIPLANTAGRDRFLIFFGCSFTYGFGLNADETLPFYMGRAAPKYRPYNYAVSGWGPHQTLALLKTRELFKEIPLSKGIGLYVFIPHHVNRVIGGMSRTKSCPRAPYFKLQDGRLVWDGNFTTGRPFLTWLYLHLEKSSLVRLFGLEFPPKNTERHFALTCAVMKEMRNEFKKQFPVSDFYIVRHPMHIFSEMEDRNIFLKATSCLDRKDLIDFSADEVKLISAIPGGPYLPYDTHPKAEVNSIMAELLAKKLNISDTAAGPLKIGAGTNANPVF